MPQIDKEGAQPERVKQELAEAGLLPEEWGGQTAVVPVRLTALQSWSPVKLPPEVLKMAHCSGLHFLGVTTHG